MEGQAATYAPPPEYTTFHPPGAPPSLASHVPAAPAPFSSGVPVAQPQPSYPQPQVGVPPPAAAQPIPAGPPPATYGSAVPQPEAYTVQGAYPVGQAYPPPPPPRQQPTYPNAYARPQEAPQPDMMAFGRPSPQQTPTPQYPGPGVGPYAQPAQPPHMLEKMMLLQHEDRNLDRIVGAATEYLTSQYRKMERTMNSTVQSTRLRSDVVAQRLLEIDAEEKRLREERAQLSAEQGELQSVLRSYETDLAVIAKQVREVGSFMEESSSTLFNSRAQSSSQPLPTREPQASAASVCTEPLPYGRSSLQARDDRMEGVGNGRGHTRSPRPQREEQRRQRDRGNRDSTSEEESDEYRKPVRYHSRARSPHPSRSPHDDRKTHREEEKRRGNESRHSFRDEGRDDRDDRDDRDTSRSARSSGAGARERPRHTEKDHWEDFESDGKQRKSTTRRRWDN